MKMHLSSRLEYSITLDVPEHILNEAKEQFVDVENADDLGDWLEEYIKDTGLSIYDFTTPDVWDDEELEVVDVYDA